MFSEKIHFCLSLMVSAFTELFLFCGIETSASNFLEKSRNVLFKGEVGKFTIRFASPCCKGHNILAKPQNYWYFERVDNKNRTKSRYTEDHLGIQV